MLKQTRREFLRTAGAVSIGASRVLAETKKGNGSHSKENAEAKAQAKKPMSKIRVAQIKVYPDKGRIEANHIKLMKIFGDIERNHEVDVVVTPEGFLDGYVATEKSVTKDDMVKYAIDQYQPYKDIGNKYALNAYSIKTESFTQDIHVRFFCAQRLP